MAKNQLQLVLTQLQCVWNKPSWTVTISQALDRVEAGDAAWKCGEAGGNTIWQIVNHMNFYNERMLNRLKGLPQGASADSNEATFGEPGAADHQSEWRDTVSRTLAIGSEILTALEQLSANSAEGGEDERLTEDLAKWLLHDTFHVGQIVQIRKQQGSWPAQRVFE
ncbi:conserved hypothetical protein [Paenibacillus curdlanolyticus YK9]|uniref:DinB-like domain-containing protein n=1 Tax=Paenibacillus curdlanolyticus YK9 TaxID=717606 RepID=E0I7H2_9BACL|nr:DinB family protein [Paenibacillus curdlanolyticus]EFM11988.1 conserved hypothetical protein [Paenibacillus curdlanolyticus YK9]